MTKSQNTKKALLASVISMLICVAMLLGSTFAWFTDSVIGGTNTIVAGNLAAEVQTSTDLVNWTKVEEGTNLFGDENTLWEPGHVEFAVVKVQNVGDMAFEY